ncbi:hypothetical protein SAMN05892877_13242 [Rhizobium subbaraonis]|uniref:Phage terminase Nu1 subunit (DNA packaging protein) n=1 Tax=Rhizobium subbaraonis TaxID=908946 RepID=A0A285V3Y3_9HYPH|nr:hypothetical protein [Rhizobium subbaraonis]SOC47716.1 hypothetical protein SAMN05892877_13242 [Rhizobium subbaraonis]
MSEEQQAGTIPLAMAARLLMISEERVRQLVKMEYIPKVRKGMYPLVGVVQGYIRFLKDEERRSSKSATASRMQEAKATEIDMRIAEKRRELIPIDEAHAVIDTLVGKVRSEISAVPKRVTRDLAVRKKIESEVNGSLNRIAEAMVALATTLREGGDLPGGAGSDDA